MNNIPKQNYIMVAVISLITIIITIGLSTNYKNSHQNNDTSILNKFLTVITANDFDSYIMENPNIVIYVGDSQSTAYQHFEQDLKQEITSYDIQNHFVYLDTNNINDNFRLKLSTNYNINLNDYKVPILIFFQEGRVIDIVSSNDYTIEKLIEFFRKYEVLE